MAALLTRLGYGPQRSDRYTYFYCDGSKPKPSLRGVSHEIFFALTPFFAADLLSRCTTPRATWGALGFILGWAVQFGVSSQFHRRRWSLAAEQFISDLDHVGILMMVAGAYCPMTLLLPQQKAIIVGTGIVGCLGVGARHSFVKRGGRWSETAVAIGMVACVLSAAPMMYARCTTTEWRLHMGSLLQYLLGGVAYASHWPDPWPKTFGSQEILHLMTCTGAVTVFLMNRTIVTRL